MSIKVSVIVPTYKRPALLKQCVEALSNQCFNTNEYEVIIVTDGPDNETQNVLHKIQAETKSSLSVKVLSLAQKKGPAAARNMGWKNASGELILFTDDDCIPASSWVENYWLQYVKMQRDEIAFSGNLKVPLSAKPTDFERNTSLLELASFVTANCACTKKALQKVKGFDEDFTMAWREDSAFEFDLIKNNIPIIKAENATVIHPVRKAAWGISIKEQKKSMFNPLLYKKHPALYKQKITAGIPWFYYGILVLTLTALVSFFLNQSLLKNISMAGALMLIIMFVFKRLKGISWKWKHILEMIFTSAIIPFLSIFWTWKGNFRFKTLLL